jgi:hypothetical protein
MKAILVFLSLGCFYGLYAQPVYNSCASQRAFGDSTLPQSFSAVTCDTTGVTPGDSGANVTWDFSGLVTKTSGTYPVPSTYYYDPATTPWSSNFPHATIAYKSSASTTYYYDYASPDSAGTWGFYDSGTKTVQGNCLVYSAPSKSFVCPCPYGTSFTSRAAGYRCGDNMFTQHYATTTKTYDAYGTLIMPTGTYQNAVRFKTVEDDIDSVYMIILGNTTLAYVYTLTSTTYAWNTSDFNNPLLSIGYLSTAGLNSKSVNYIVNSTAVRDVTVKNTDHQPRVTLGPNPFTNFTVISVTGDVPLQNISLKICSLAGREVEQLKKINDTQFLVQKKDLKSGIYVYQIESGKNIVGAGKFVVQ